MATRTRKTWRPGTDGQYARQLGWKAGRNGKLVQPKFRLGTDLREARHRELMLTKMWEDVEASASQEPATWPEGLLTIAQQVARHGKAVIAKLDGEPDGLYLVRVERLAQRFAGVPLYLEDEESYREAAQARARSSAEFLQHFDRAARALHNRMHGALEKFGGKPTGEVEVAGPTLHAALREHVDWLKQEYAGEDGKLTAWGKVRVKHVELLIERHEDVRLKQLDHEKLEGMIRYWRQRPPRKGTNRPIAKQSAEHQIAAIRNFVRWLSRSTKYPWRKPDSFDEIRSRVGSRVDDVRRQVTPEDIFTLDELVLLNRYANPSSACCCWASTAALGARRSRR